MASAVLENTIQYQSEVGSSNQVVGEKIGFVASIFGCWHERVSRPFTEGKSAYQSCLKCGARRPFDATNLKTGKRFYYPPVIK